MWVIWPPLAAALAAAVEYDAAAGEYDVVAVVPLLTGVIVGEFPGTLHVYMHTTMSCTIHVHICSYRNQ